MNDFQFDVQAHHDKVLSAIDKAVQDQYIKVGGMIIIPIEDMPQDEIHFISCRPGMKSQKVILKHDQQS